MQMRGKHLQQRQHSAQEGSTAALAGFSFCSKEDGSVTDTAKTTRITTKDSDDQNNSLVEDSKDKRAKEWQSSFLKVLIVLNNRRFFSLSSF